MPSALFLRIKSGLSEHTPVAASASPVCSLHICIFDKMRCAPPLQPSFPAPPHKPCTKALKLAPSSAGAFSVGVPERFVANYIASQSFLGRLEVMCGDTRALDAFRGSAAYRSWQGRWKLSVYYGLCFQVDTRREAWSMRHYSLAAGIHWPATSRTYWLQWPLGVSEQILSFCL